MVFQTHLAAQNEFWRLHRAATVRVFLNRLGHRPTHLCAFEEARRNFYATSLGPRTLQEVPLQDIIGSVGRAFDYAPGFLPRRGGDEARWVRVRQAVETEGVPPLELYQLGKELFVHDGHHRVSVLRSLGVKTAEAYVTEIRVQAGGDVRSPVQRVGLATNGEAAPCPT